MPTPKEQFNVYVYPSDIKRFKKITRKMGVSQAFLFKTALDLFTQSKMGHNVSREPIQKASQTAQKALRRASKRGVMVREGGAE